MFIIFLINNTFIINGIIPLSSSFFDNGEWDLCISVLFTLDKYLYLPSLCKKSMHNHIICSIKTFTFIDTRAPVKYGECIFAFKSSSVNSIFFWDRHQGYLCYHFYQRKPRLCISSHLKLYFLCVFLLVLDLIYC